MINGLLLQLDFAKYAIASEVINIT